ncbi:MAG: hypothetical protein K2X76_07455 [Sphingomonas sp.]|nr:hypothetical protein [Sphingomonas sp.]
MKRDSDLQQTLVAIVRRLDEALELLDAMDIGDGECAASIERAVQRAKRELRTSFGSPTRRLPPLPAGQRRLRRAPLPTKMQSRPFRTDRKS